MFQFLAARRIGTSATSDLTWFAKFCALFGFRTSKSKLAASAETRTIISSAKLSISQNMFSSPIQKAAARIPMIKFLGPRLPRPNFNREALPSIPISGSAGGAPLVAAKPSSIGAVGKIPRGQCIPEEQLPLKFRRQPISQEECDIINNGGVL